MTSHVSDYGLKLKFDLRPAQMEDLISDIITKAKKKQDKIAAIPLKKRTFENTVRALAIANGTAQNKSAQCSFPLLVSPTKEVRDAANACNVTFTDFLIETNMRRDLYEAVRHVADSGERFDAEESRLLQKMLSDFERNGVHLEEEKYARVKTIRKRINDLCLKFNQNVNEVETTVPFTREQLQGMSEDFLANLKRDGDKYLVSLHYPELYPVLEECKVPETRRIMDITNGERCVDENLPLLKEIIALRQEAALLQGYDCDASYELAIKMAKDKDTVRKFLYDMSEKLEPLHTLEMTEMLALKKAECAKNGWKFDGAITSWDFRYYQRAYLRAKFNVDHEEIRQYFPYEFTVRGILDVYQHIFDLKFEEDVGAHVWHPDVKRFSVLGKDGEFYGHFYLDMFPRSGKYSHAACFPIQLRQETDKGMDYTATAIVCNFTQPTAEKPSLLQFSEVQTFFHEFGHLMHSICSKSRFSRLNWTWTAVEQDFLECPSMMLEQWSFAPLVLERVSGYYKDTDVKLPKPLLESLIRAKNADMALNTRMIIFQSLFDLDMHSTGESDFWDKAWRKYKFEQTGIRSPLEVKPYASWMHVTSGYNAGYYSYIWSEVFSKDMFAKFLEAKEGALDREMGVKFRKTILEPCCIEDGMDMLKKFLGREPTQKAFFDDLGIKT